MENDQVHILLVNTGTVDVSFEKMKFHHSEKDTIKNAILDGINRLGKQSHALVKFQGRFFVCDHTSRKGPSKDYYRHEVKYHPFAGELA